MEHLPNSEPMKRRWQGFEEFDRMINEGLATVALVDVDIELVELPEEL